MLAWWIFGCCGFEKKAALEIHLCNPSISFTIYIYICLSVICKNEPHASKSSSWRRLRILHKDCAKSILSNCYTLGPPSFWSAKVIPYHGRESRQIEAGFIGIVSRDFANPNLIRCLQVMTWWPCSSSDSTPQEFNRCSVVTVGATCRIPCGFLMCKVYHRNAGLHLSPGSFASRFTNWLIFAALSEYQYFHSIFHEINHPAIGVPPFMIWTYWRTIITIITVY